MSNKHQVFLKLSDSVEVAIEEPACLNDGGAAYARIILDGGNEGKSGRLSREQLSELRALCSRLLGQHPESPAAQMEDCTREWLADMESRLRGARELQVYDNRWAILIAPLLPFVSYGRQLLEAMAVVGEWSAETGMGSLARDLPDDILERYPAPENRLYGGKDAHRLWNEVLIEKDRRRG